MKTMESMYVTSFSHIGSPLAFVFVVKKRGRGGGGGGLADLAGVNASGLHVLNGELLSAPRQRGQILSG